MRFLAPIALAFAATIPVVVIFYLLKRKRVIKLISSTVLWQRFLADTQANAPFQKLRHNWLLILQILLLILAVMALARPYIAGRENKAQLLVVVLDASASMQATDEKPTRFEKARSEAMKLAEGLRENEQMMVLVAGVFSMRDLVVGLLQSSGSPDPAQAAAFIATQTDTLKLLLAHRPNLSIPTFMAKTLATLAIESGVRVTFVACCDLPWTVMVSLPAT